MNIFNLSFGKDSMATLILAAEQGIPIDRVMYCDIRFNDEISGEHPLMAEWIPKAEQILKERFGITVDHAFSRTYLDWFFKKNHRGNHIGDMHGFPHILSAWCNTILKIQAINRYLSQFNKQQTITFVGIAFDEPKRWERMRAKETEIHKYRSLLVEQKLTEQDAFRICEKYELLSPIYKSEDGIYRGGCWFCPKQSLADLYSLWKNYPELFDILIEMEKVSINTFKPNGVTLASLAERFAAGDIPKRRKKRQTSVQMDMFKDLK